MSAVVRTLITDEEISERPELSTCQFNYTPPLHVAVREGHLSLVRALVERHALDPSYKTYPFGIPS